MRRPRRTIMDAPEVRAALLASRWAQQIGLEPGNLWEPAIVRNVLKEYEQIGPDASAWALVEALWCIRLGLKVEAV